MDYLLIECSGSMDPVDVIELIERKYDKMTRARLDAVICVVDTDALEHFVHPNSADSADKELKQPDHVHQNQHSHHNHHNHLSVPEVKEEVGPKLLDVDMTLIRKQLERADVIVLNKIDLVSNNQYVCFVVATALTIAVRIERVRHFVATLNPAARVLTCQRSAVPLTAVMGVSEVPRDTEV